MTEVRAKHAFCLSSVNRFMVLRGSSIELVRRPESDVLINTDYLVVGAGASGLAFADALVAEADVEVTVVDRRRAPGGAIGCTRIRSFAFIPRPRITG